MTIHTHFYFTKSNIAVTSCLLNYQLVIMLEESNMPNKEKNLLNTLFSYF